MIVCCPVCEQDRLSDADGMMPHLDATGIDCTASHLDFAFAMRNRRVLKSRLVTKRTRHDDRQHQLQVAQRIVTGARKKIRGRWHFMWRGRWRPEGIACR